MMPPITQLNDSSLRHKITRPLFITSGKEKITIYVIEKFLLIYVLNLFANFGEVSS